MSRLRASLLSVAVLLFSAQLALAANYAVGTCKSSLPSYPTISAAVAGVPAGSTIEVCPGTYSEQVFINQALTLEGIASGNSSDVVILPPASGLTTVTDSYSGLTFAPLVEVTTGPVNISNVTVDGTGNNVSCSNPGQTWLIGIFYNDGSSGTVNEVTARNMTTSGCGDGTGVWAESSGSDAVTIENSSFHDNEDSSIISYGSLVATIKGNTTVGSTYNVQWLSLGTVTANVFEGAYYGIYSESSGTISGNTITNSTFAGLYPFGFGAVFTSNKISASPYGIYLLDFGSGDTFKSNTITKTGTGVEFNCYAATVSSNIINDAGTGLDQVPSSFSGSNHFDNVATIRTNCASVASKHGLAGTPGKPLTTFDKNK